MGISVSPPCTAHNGRIVQAVCEGLFFCIPDKKDGNRARKCAEAMRAAVGNMNIGYDQGQRNSILPAARNTGMALGAIRTLCECDCSSLDGVCGIAAGAPEDAIYRGGNLCYTGDIIERFKATGLVDIYGPIYASNSANLQNGDMLISNSHAVVVVSGAKEPSGTASGNGSTGVDIDALADAVIAGRYGNGDARRAALGANYDAVQKRVNEKLAGTANAPGTSTGVPRIVAGTYKVVASSLNVRSAPSLSGSIVAHYNAASCINGIGADVVEADGYVWAHHTAFSGNVRYVAIGSVDGMEKYLVKC